MTDKAMLPVDECVVIDNNTSMAIDKIAEEMANLAGIYSTKDNPKSRQLFIEGLSHRIQEAIKR